VTVTVLNGTGEPGLATAQAQALDDLGFSAEVDRSGTTTKLTTITYPAGLEAQAKAVAAVVPGAVVAPSSSGTGVTLTLGPDGHRVSTGTASPASSSSGTPSAAAPSSATASSAPKTFSGTACVN
jgi:hypothetical protein